jgi:hypothetical protein
MTWESAHPGHIHHPYYNEVFVRLCVCPCKDSMKQLRTRMDMSAGGWECSMNVLPGRWYFALRASHGLLCLVLSCTVVLLDGLGRVVAILRPRQQHTPGWTYVLTVLEPTSPVVVVV